MLTFLKRERAVQQCWLSGLLALVLVLIMGGLVSELPEELAEELLGIDRKRGFLSSYAFIALFALQAAVIVTARDFPLSVRVRDYERTLPVTMRRVVLERLGSIWVSLFVTFFLGSLAWFVKMPDGAELSLYARIIGRAFLVSGVSAAVLGIYLPSRPSLNMIETLVLTGFSLSVWALSIWSESPLVDLAFLAALAGLIAVLWNTLPESSLVEDPSTLSAPEAAVGFTETGAATGALEPASLPVRLFGPLRWAIIRGSLLRPQVLILAPATFVLALIGGGAPFWSCWFLAIVAFFTVRMGLNVVYGIDSLPIHRERVLRIAGLASLVYVAIAMVMFTGVDRSSQSYELVTWGVEVDRCSDKGWGFDEPYRTHVKVPASEWRMTSDPSEAVVTAPWGETVAPKLHPVHPWASTFIYNPYDVQPSSSGKLLAWQVRRALEEVHGPTDQVNDRFADWLDRVPMDTAIADMRRRSQLDATSADWGYDVVKRSETPNSIGFALLGAWLIWLLATAFALRPNVLSVHAPSWWSKLPSQTWATLLLAPLAVVFVVIQKNDRTLMPVLAERLYAWIDGLLGSSPFLWAALVIGLMGLSYAFLAWRIQRIEVPPLATDGWTKKPMAIY